MEGQRGPEYGPGTTEGSRKVLCEHHDLETGLVYAIPLRIVREIQRNAYSPMEAIFIMYATSQRLSAHLDRSSKCRQRMAELLVARCNALNCPTSLSIITYVNRRYKLDAELLRHIEHCTFCLEEVAEYTSDRINHNEF